MTPNAQAVRDFIYTHKDKWDFEPSKFAIHEATGVSRSEIDRILKDMEEEGLLKRLLVKRGQYIVT